MDVIALDEQARAIMRGNDRQDYTVPTAGLYPYQWNWDSAFAAWGFATFDVERAWTELETLLAGQWSNGMVPHILFHASDPGYFPGPDVWGTDGIGPISSSGISQPPVAAIFARALYERDPEVGAKRLGPLLPKLLAWHRWFMDWRTVGGAVFVTHPWEAGRDNCCDWDSAMALIDPVGVGDYTRRDTSHVDPKMRPTKADYDRYIWLVQRGRRMNWDDASMAEDRPFAVLDPTLTFVLVRAHRDLSAMYRALGQPNADIDAEVERLTKGAAELRNPKTGFFDAVNMRSGEHTGHLSSASFLCWFAGMDSDEMRGVLDEALSARYPIASQRIGTPEYDPMRYWRGPTWAIMNALIAMGLRDAGLDDEAARLRDGTRALIADHGFAEYFHPETGAPAGGGSFTWTAAVWLAWASPTAGGT